MYLTRVTLKPCSYLTFLKKSPQKLHAAIAEAFNGSQRRWRMDHNDVLWVVSGTEPVSPQSLPGDFATRDLEPLRDALTQGRRVAFRLKANTTLGLAPEEGSSRGKVIQLTNPEKQLEWLANRVESLGFEIDSVSITDSGLESFRHRNGQVKFAWVVFEGTAIVQDTDVLMEALATGIGKKGGYGCGLLTVAPA